MLTKKLQVFTPPTAYDAASQQPTGSRFGADAMYQGENRKGGAIISYYINVPKVDEKEKKESEEKNQDDEDEKDADKEKNNVKNDSIKLEIFDGERLIRTLKFKTPKESGI